MSTQNDAENSWGEPEKPDPQRVADRERLDNAVIGLREHFDSVLIIVTRDEDDPADPGTLWDYAARGNNFANAAAAERYLEHKREHFKMRVRGQ